jgi:hypothetical protein
VTVYQLIFFIKKSFATVSDAANFNSSQEAIVSCSVLAKRGLSRDTRAAHFSADKFYPSFRPSKARRTLMAARPRVIARFRPRLCAGGLKNSPGDRRRKSVN